MADLVRNALVASLKGLLASGDYSDLTIICGTDTYNVHKSIVCSQSTFFKNSEKFPVGKEAAEGVVYLPADDPAIVKHLIGFFYGGEYEPSLPTPQIDSSSSIDYPITVPRRKGFEYDFPHSCTGYFSQRVCPHHTCGTSKARVLVKAFVCDECTGKPAPKGPASQLLLHAQMYEIADKYDVPSLRSLSKEKFRRATTNYWDDDQFAIAAEHALNTTPGNDEGLRGILATIITRHSQLLNKPAIETLINGHAAFAYAVLKRQAEEVDRLKPSTAL